MALLLAAKSYLSQSNFDANIDQSTIVAEGFPSFTTRGTTQYRLDQITFSLAKIDNRFLLREQYEPKDLFDEIKLYINLVGGTLSGDDTVIDKPSSDLKLTIFLL